MAPKFLETFQGAVALLEHPCSVGLIRKDSLEHVFFMVDTWK